MTHSDVWLKQSKPRQSCVTMVRCPHDIFCHILSFKDPRYEHVHRGGDPFGKTPTRVWYTRREYKGLTDGIKRTPAIVRYSNPVVITTYRHGLTWWQNNMERPFEVSRGIRRLELRMNSDMFDRSDNGADEKCLRKLADMSLQCEACDP